MMRELQSEKKKINQMLSCNVVSQTNVLMYPVPMKRSPKRTDESVMVTELLEKTSSMLQGGR